MDILEVDDMRCPICDKEMEIGKLRSRGGVYFLPDGEKCTHMKPLTEA